MADKVLTAPRVIAGEQTVSDGAVVIGDRTVSWAGPAAELPAEYADLPRSDYPDGTILPGLIDSHVHLGFDGGPDPVGRMRAETDAQQLVTLFLNPGAIEGRQSAPPLPAFGLANDTSVVTALCNDVGVEVVFARQLAAFGGRNDIAVGLSTSGNSANLLRAFDEASRRGMLTVGLAGYDGGRMAELDSIDYLFVVPSSSVHRIQEAQTTIYQVLWELTVEEMAHVPRHTR